MSDFRRFVQFKEAKARTISGAFATFIDQQIGIPSGTRSRASTNQNALRDFLAGVTDDDSSFPRILSIADRDFLGGSFARHVKVWPLNDIDVYFPIDGTDFIYNRGGWRLPYTPLNDGVLDENPLMMDRNRWWDGSRLSSSKLINGFAKVLRKHYPTTTRVRRGGEAVTVTLANDLGFDVVPCFSMKPDNPYEQPFYVIPDGNDGWIHTNPRLDKELSDQLHRDNDETLRPAVKLLKWWNDEYLGGRMPSYYAELAIMRAFQQRNLMGQKIATVSLATFIAFRAVRDALNNGDQAPLLQGAPTVEPGDVTRQDMQILSNDVLNSQAAYQHEVAGRIDDALASWRVVFGQEFPSA